jgi:hypothetical protein
MIDSKEQQEEDISECKIDILRGTQKVIPFIKTTKKGKLQMR